tara:strand:- start:1243 stop:1623 length:381 start_codon:yes stop_codon:yes gene_type:complete
MYANKEKGRIVIGKNGKRFRVMPTDQKKDQRMASAATGLPPAKATHTMPSGVVMSGATHSPRSKKIRFKVNKQLGPERKTPLQNKKDLADVSSRMKMLARLKASMRKAGPTELKVIQAEIVKLLKF